MGKMGRSLEMPKKKKRPFRCLGCRIQCTFSIGSKIDTNVKNKQEMSIRTIPCVYKSQNCFCKTNFFISQIQREFEYIFSKFKCIFPLFPLVRNTREEIVLFYCWQEVVIFMKVSRQRIEQCGYIVGTRIL